MSPGGNKSATCDDEISLLKAKIGDITIENELLYAKIDKLEARHPLDRTRSRTLASQFRPQKQGLRDGARLPHVERFASHGLPS